jgi:AcrR family transcriptional regulator
MGIDETREKIVSVADKLFSRFGFHKTSMDEIAKTSRKAKGSLYYHFASKEELFREVVMNEMNELKAKLSEVVNRRDQPSEEKLKTYMMTRMEVLQKAGNYKETIQPGHFDHFEFVDDIRQDLDAWEKEQLETIIREGIERGEFELEVEVGVLIDMFIMIAKGLEIPFFLQGRYEEYRPYFDGMARILMKGMRP